MTDVDDADIATGRSGAQREDDHPQMRAVELELRGVTGGTELAAAASPPQFRESTPTYVTWHVDHPTSSGP
jgi:hypothetical protein